MKKTAVNILFILALLSFTAHADYFDLSADSITKTSSPVFVRGCVILTNGSCAPGITINATLYSGTTVVSSNTGVTTAGMLEFNLTSSSTAGDYYIRAYAQGGNTSLVSPVTMPTSARAVSSANISLLSSKQPFSNASVFSINVSFDGNLATEPSMKVYSPNSNVSAIWTFTQVGQTESSRAYNVTIPASAAGRYFISAENGAGFLPFFVKSPTFVIAYTQSLDNATKRVFSPSANVYIVAKIRDGAGPRDGTVTAYITKPDATVTAGTMTGANGTYQATFTDTSSTGTYLIRIGTNLSAKIEATSFFTVKSLDAKLEVVKDLFFEFGSASSFGTDSQAGFNVLVYDRANSDTLLAGAVNSSAGFVNCGNITPILFRNAVTGAVIPFSASNITQSLSSYFGQDICKINFTSPGAPGIYKITFNVLTGNETSNSTANATAYFSVKRFVLKASPISSSQFLNALYPGQNATFEIIARDLTKEGNVTNNSIVYWINATRITPLNGVGQQDITSFTYSIIPASANSNARAVVMLPENLTGQFNIEFIANVSNSTVISSTFYTAKYIDGFVTPVGYFNNTNLASTFRCAGTMNFTAKVYDVLTKQAVENVTFISLNTATDETGRSVKDYLSMNATNSTLSGLANISITFSSSVSYSGFYTMTLNASLPNNKTDLISAGFTCKPLNFFPALSSNGLAAKRTGVDTVISVNVSNIFNVANGTPILTENGSVSVLRLENVDKISGIKYFTSSVSFSLAAGSSVFNIYPDNFSLTRWPSDFNRVVFYVCDNATTPQTCDYGYAGFTAMPFEMYSTEIFSIRNLTGLQNLSINVSVRANATRNSGNYSGSGANITTTGFKLTIGQPWNGFSSVAPAVSSLILDNWSSLNGTGYEVWNVTFTIPSGAKPGTNMLTLIAKNQQNELVYSDPIGLTYYNVTP